MLSSDFHFIRDHLFTLPVLAKFALGMVMLAVIPLVSRRLHIPAAVGLLLGGIVVGTVSSSTFSARWGRLPISWRSWESCC